MNPAKPSPTADERRQKIAASNELVTRKRRQTQDLIDRKNRLALQAKADHQKALDEKSRVMDGAERQLMIQQRQNDYRNAAANAIVQKENEKEIKRLERWDEIKQVGEELSEISVSWEDLPTLPDILFDDNPA